MTNQQLGPRPPYTTDRDPSLPHQVVFTVTAGVAYVSCNCRRTATGKYDPIGTCHTIKRAHELYDNPENHFKEFSKEDEGKW